MAGQRAGGQARGGRAGRHAPLSPDLFDGDDAGRARAHLIDLDCHRRAAGAVRGGALCAALANGRQLATPALARALGAVRARVPVQCGARREEFRAEASELARRVLSVRAAGVRAGPLSRHPVQARGAKKSGGQNCGRRRPAACRRGWAIGLAHWHARPAGRQAGGGQAQAISDGEALFWSGWVPSPRRSTFSLKSDLTARHSRFGF